MGSLCSKDQSSDRVEPASQLLPAHPECFLRCNNSDLVRLDAQTQPFHDLLARFQPYRGIFFDDNVIIVQSSIFAEITGSDLLMRHLHVRKRILPVTEIICLRKNYQLVASAGCVPRIGILKSVCLVL
jgi:hypothetical protein